jgi:hypothetical protein
MEQELPSLAYQRAKLFRPKHADIIYAYNILNRYVFDNQLVRPEITQGRVKTAWAFCSWELKEQASGSHTYIRLSDKWFCPQWFMNTLVHEMVHQYQWDIYRWDHEEYYGRKMNDASGAHGPSFYMWRERAEHYGLNLKRYHRQMKWFKFQDFNKC